MQSILILGRQGQVAQALLSHGPILTDHKVIAIGRPDLDFLSTSFEQDLEELVRFHHPSVVINAAAYTDVDPAESEIAKAMIINGYAVGVIARVCARHHIALFHISSDYVFDGESDQPRSPEDLPLPLSVYGRSKLLGEQLIHDVVRTSHLHALILRVSWVFSNLGHNFVNTVIRLANEQSEITIVSDQVGGPTSADSIATALLSVVDAAIANRHPVAQGSLSFPWGTYHFQGHPLVSWYDFACEIVDQACNLHVLEQAPEIVPIDSSRWRAVAQRPKRSALDCQSAVRELGLSLPLWSRDLRLCLASIRP